MFITGAQRMTPLIGIDGSRLSRVEKTGTETYSDAIIEELVRNHDEAEWRIYLDRDLGRPHWSDRAQARTITAPRLWTHGRLSIEMATRPPDLLFVPAHVVPVVHPRSVVTIHDLGYLHVPEGHPPRQRRMLDAATRWNAYAACRIIVPSTHTKRDLIHRYGTAEDRIAVVHHGVDERFRRAAPRQGPRVREAYRLRRSYLLAVGTIHPRKNLSALARATARLVARGRDLDLVIAGKDGWLAGDVHDQLLATGLGARLKTLNYVAAVDLASLYAGAACFVQPSLFEGFGMPVVEAMASGAPVVCARNSSLPEIAAEGADYFDTVDDEHLASILEGILADDGYRARLIERGRRRAESFSWARCASETMAVLARALPGTSD